MYKAMQLRHIYILKLKKTIIY